MITVLLVDDESEALDAWQIVCESAGHRVHRAQNGQEALELLRKQPVDVVVADWRMPVMSGSLLCYHVRNEPALVNVVFILVSGEPSPPAFIYYDGFLRKPVLPGELLTTIERLLDERRVNGPHKRSAG
jgi:two-component system response regulator ChvI